MSDSIIVENGYVKATFEGSSSSEYKIISEDIFHLSNNTENILGISTEQLEAFRNSLKVSFTDYGHVVNAYKIEILKDGISFNEEGIIIDILKSNDINMYKSIKLFYLPSLSGSFDLNREIKFKNTNEKITFNYLDTGIYIIVGNNDLPFDFETDKIPSNIIDALTSNISKEKKNQLSSKNINFKIAFERGASKYSKGLNPSHNTSRRSSNIGRKKEDSSSSSLSQENVASNLSNVSASDEIAPRVNNINYSLNIQSQSKEIQEKIPEQGSNQKEITEKTTTTSRLIPDDTQNKPSSGFGGFDLSAFEEDDEDEGYFNNPFNNKSRKATTTSPLSYLVDYKKEIFFVIFFVIAMIIYIMVAVSAVISADSDKDPKTKYEYVDERYDFSKAIIRINNPFPTASDEEYLESANIADYVLGNIYLDFYDKLDEINTTQFYELVKAKSIVAKTKIFKLSKYTSGLMEGITNNSDSDIAFCNIYAGCKKVRYMNKIIYVSGNNTAEIHGDVIEEILPADEQLIKIMVSAYTETIYNLLTDKEFKKPLTSHSDLPNIITNDRINDSMLSGAIQGKNYTQIISDVPEYNKYKIYDLKEHASLFSTSNPIKYWWPIGSDTPNADGTYTGKPTTTKIANYFVREPDDEHPKIHLGIDIVPENPNGNATVVAIADGTVVQAKSNCRNSSSYECKTYGNHVIIDHGNRIYSIYGNLGSVTVSAGQSVKRATKIGTMGKGPEHEGNYLHFSIAAGSLTSHTDPLQYISAYAPRPSSNVNNIELVEGNDNMQTVCLSLLSSGFSPYAVAGLLANIKAESNFNPTALGDNGTSYGLCQWHKGRWDRLKNFCGAEESDIGCQLSYLVHELKQGYTNVYNVLLNSNSAFETGYRFCYNFEIPASRNSGGCDRRGNTAESLLDYVNNNCSN